MYTIKLPTDLQETRFLDLEFGRINVPLGANGTGKSKTIQNLTKQCRIFGEVRPLVYVEGGRVIALPDSVGLVQGTVDQFKHLRQASQQLKESKHAQTLSNRTKNVFIILNIFW
jgi:predicted ATPase